MFREKGNKSSGIDILVTGTDHPYYLKPPQKESMAHPDTDKNAACEPESGHLGFFREIHEPKQHHDKALYGSGQPAHLADGKFPRTFSA